MKMLVVVLVVILIISKLLLLRSEKRKLKIFGIYSQNNCRWFYFKYYFLLFKLTWDRIKIKCLQSSNRLNLEEKLEKLQALSNHEKAFDAVFFQGVNEEGFYFCGGLERRHNGKANGLFYIVTPHLGLLKSERLPKTLLQSDPVSLLLLKEYSAEGIKFTPVEAMKKWKIQFKGKMKLESTGDDYDVDFIADWNSNGYPYFLYERDLSIRALARALAREEWSKDLFEQLKKNKQNHYEQMGALTGKLSIGEEIFNIDMDGFRDHSFGYKRDWKLIHRYIFHMMYLENGTKISLGVISYPSTMTHFEVGYVVNSDKNIYPIDECNLVLYQHGERGKPGKNIGFSFKANDLRYDVNVKVIHESFHYKGNDCEARLIERFVEYEVNGVKGRGISEWSYNTNNGKLKF